MGPDAGSRQPLKPDLGAWAESGSGFDPLRPYRDLVDPVASMLPEKLPDPGQWRHERVGWGLIVAEPEGVSAADLASGKDLPEALHQLLRERPDAPVLRYRKSFKPSLRLSYLRDWKRGVDVPLDHPPQGVGAGRLPAYLLIVGSPRDVPWELQFALNSIRFVGRLDLDEAGLERYVAALLSDWRREDPSAEQRRRVARRVLVWAVDHGGGDITSLLRQGIALEVHAAVDGDADIQSRLLDGRREEATAGKLIEALAREPAGLVVSTSHGFIQAPADVLASRLGLPVDQDYRPLDPAELLDAWQPDGAVWYAHACCSAGSCGGSLYADLFADGADIRGTFALLQEAGSLQGALPRALLSASRPARAFIGHVEPTFDWTLRHPETRRRLSTNLVQNALVSGLLAGDRGVGRAFESWHRQAASLYSRWETARAEASFGQVEASMLLYLRLAARDVQSTVLLGDPTVRLPVLG